MNTKRQLPERVVPKMQKSSPVKPTAGSGYTGYKYPRGVQLPRWIPATLKKVKGYKKGGKVKKTGLAKLHKGERVLTKKQARKFDKKRFDKARRKHFGM